MNTISSISYLHLNNYREENENCTCIAFHHLPRHHHHHHRHHHYYLLHSIENGGTTQPWHCIASHCHQPRPSVISRDINHSSARKRNLHCINQCRTVQWRAATAIAKCIFKFELFQNAHNCRHKLFNSVAENSSPYAETRRETIGKGDGKWDLLEPAQHKRQIRKIYKNGNEWRKNWRIKYNNKNYLSAHKSQHRTAWFMSSLILNHPLRHISYFYFLSIHIFPSSSFPAPHSFLSTLAFKRNSPSPWYDF